MPTKADLEEEVARLTQERTDLHQRIRDEVKRVAEENDWCQDGQREALNNLGVEPISNRFEGMIVVRINVSGDSVSQVDPSARFLRDSFDHDQLVDHLGLDDDWSDGTFTLESVEVENWQKEGTA